MSTEDSKVAERAPNPEGDSQPVPIVLITLQQRDALIEFMAKQPYADVANGIDFLRSAPQVNVTITPPESTETREAGSSNK